MNQQDKTPPQATGKGQWWLSGKTPDYRFTLANERTFLAWIRTALALLAGAVGIDQFSPHLGSPDLRFGLAMLLVAGGMALSATAWRRWRRNEHAMRLERELPYTRFLFLLTVFMTLVALLLAILLWQNVPLIPRDPGLQPERTRLAWSRTGFSLALFTLLCLRGWCRDGNPFYAGATLICGVAAATILFNRHQRNGKHILSLSLFMAGMLLLINGLRHILG